MDLARLENELHSFLDDGTLLADVNLARRAQALALIALLQEMARLHRDQPTLTTLLQQAAALQAQIEQVDQQLFQHFRTAIRQGQSRGPHLFSLLQRFTAATTNAAATRYFNPDGLDRLVSGLLALDKGPMSQQTLMPGMVHYERTPARAILALVQRVTFTPELIFYDLGSGFGEVPILVHLLTGVQTKGVEIEPAFCRFAQQQIEELQISGVTILNADARMVDYGDGDIFFMFTPFYGAVLQTVLERLQEQAQQRAITLCTYGPCTPVVAQQPWLQPLAGSGNHEFELAIFGTNRVAGIVAQ